MPATLSIKDKKNFDELTSIIRAHKLKLIAKYGIRITSLWANKW